MRRARLDAGRRGIAEWEREHGPLTAEELADDLARAWLLRYRVAAVSVDFRETERIERHLRALLRWLGAKQPSRRSAQMAGTTYDAGALMAAERNDRRLWALHAGFLAEEVVPAPVLAQVWRGGSRQASLSQLLAMCLIEPLTDEQARRVGVLAHKDQAR